MNCNDFKTWHVNKEPVGTSSVAKARVHMDSCEACGKLGALDSLLEDQIREGLRQEEPPRELYARLEMDLLSLGKERDKALFPWKKLVPAFAVAALVLMIVINPFTGQIGSMDQFGSFALANHLDPEHAMAFKAGDVADVSGWFSERVGFPVSLPNQNVQGLTFLGGNKCVLGKSKGAYLFYEQQGKKVSLFVIDANDVSFSLGDEKRFSVYDQGHEIKIWKENNQVYARCMAKANGV